MGDEFSRELPRGLCPETWHGSWHREENLQHDCALGPGSRAGRVGPHPRDRRGPPDDDAHHRRRPQRRLFVRIPNQPHRSEPQLRRDHDVHHELHLQCRFSAGADYCRQNCPGYGNIFAFVIHSLLILS